MRLAVLAVFSVLVSGCSWLFHDHAEDYLVAKEHPVMKVPADYGDLKFQPQLIIPKTDQPFTAKEEFVVPRPDKLVVEEQEESTSLAKVKSTKLEPQLLKDGNGTPILRLGVAFPRAWSALGESLKKADVTVSDLNRSIGTYYIEVLEPVEDEGGFWSFLFGAPEPEVRTLEVKLNRARSGVYVAIHTDADTLADEEEANALLKKISDNLK